MLREITTTLVLIFALPVAAGPYEDCAQEDHKALRIQGCSTIIAAATETAQNLAAAHNNRGNAYDDQSEPARAIADYDEAIKLEPSASAYFNRGLAYRHRGEYERAIADYDKALEIDPVDVDSYNNRAEVYEAMGKLDDAIADYRKILTVNPSHTGALVGIRRITHAP